MEKPDHQVGGMFLPEKAMHDLLWPQLWKSDQKATLQGLRRNLEL